MSNPWFRMYAEFASDPIAQSLSFDDQRHYIVVLCLKCQGVLDRNLTPENRKRIIYRGLGLDPVAAEEAKRRLMEVEFIDENWQPLAWDKRQYKSDNSTDRSRKHRKNKESCNVPETCDATFPSVSVSVSNNKNKFNVPDWINPDLWQEWLDVRKKKKAVNSPTALNALVNQLTAIRDSGRYTADDAIRHAIEQSWKNVKLEWLDNLKGEQGKSSRPPSQMERVADAIRKHRNP